MQSVEERTVPLLPPQKAVTEMNESYMYFRATFWALIAVRLVLP